MVNLEHDKRVVRQPADEKSSHQCSHDFEGFGRFCHPVIPKFKDDDRVADEDDDERDHKPCEEAGECDYVVTVQV